MSKWNNQANKEKDKMMTELIRLQSLPIRSCPFCGARPHVDIFQDTFNRYKFGVECKNEECNMQPFTAWCVNGEEALSDWNGRAGFDVWFNSDADVEEDITLASNDVVESEENITLESNEVESITLASNETYTLESEVEDITLESNDDEIPQETFCYQY